MSQVLLVLRTRVSEKDYVVNHKKAVMLRCGDGNLEIIDPETEIVLISKVSPAFIENEVAKGRIILN